MKFLIRFITNNAAGGLEHSDKHIDESTITIGRATDQILHLRDRRARLQHAKIEDRDGKVYLSSNVLAGVTINGQSQRDARLVIGDFIEVGSNVLRVIEPPQGFDFALTFELKAEVSSDDVVPSLNTDTLSDVGAGKRRLSWIAAALVLGFAILIPSMSMLGGGLASLMRSNAVLPDDSWWLAGPVHSKHSSTSADCQNCHTSAFQRVPDTACLECHGTSRHVAPPADAILGEQRCASCHLEHNEPPSLVKQHHGLCADCHASLAMASGSEPAGDFLDDHPAFKTSLLKPKPSADGTTEWVVERSNFSGENNNDQSNLKFDHAAHLQVDGVVAPEGKKVMECVDCHVVEAGGGAMQAIAMDEHCVSCHTLSFDPDDSARTVPHGDPEAVLRALIEYYSARLLGADEAATQQRLRRPGETLSRADRDKVAAEAKVQAMAVAADLFERRACINCHEVTRVEGDAEMPWRVEPVRLTKSFFPLARFSHAAHDTEVTSCDGCHNASASEVASDLLIPEIDTCRECHGSAIARRNETGQTPSTCIMCHNFHLQDPDTDP